MISTCMDCTAEVGLFGQRVEFLRIVEKWMLGKEIKLASVAQKAGSTRFPLLGGT